MREIKFRGHTGAAWVYGNLIQYQDSNGKTCTQIEETKWDDFGCWSVDPESVGQFLPDIIKNSAGVYEGDIVRVREMPASPDEQDFISVVKFERGCFFVTDPRDGEPLFLSFFYDYHPNGYRPLILEIIGNTLEHPELVK